MAHRLLGLPLVEETNQELDQAEKPAAPELLAKPDEQAIAAGGEVQSAGVMEVSRDYRWKGKRGHDGSSAGAHLQAGRGQGPAVFASCAASSGTNVKQSRT